MNLGRAEYRLLKISKEQVFKEIRNNQILLFKSELQSGRMAESSESPCCEACWPEFLPRTSKEGKRELTSQSHL